MLPLEREARTGQFQIECQSIVAGSGASRFLKSREHDLDLVTAFVATLILLGGLPCDFRPVTQGLMPLSFNGYLN